MKNELLSKSQVFTTRPPDQQKAFDPTGHGILIAKLCNPDLPNSETNWIIDFLTDLNKLNRQMIVTLNGAWFHLVSHKELLGPWHFILMINDLVIENHGIWKYVDDKTTSQIVPNEAESNAQNIANKVMYWYAEKEFS